MCAILSSKEGGEVRGQQNIEATYFNQISLQTLGLAAGLFGLATVVGSLLIKRREQIWTPRSE